MQTSPAIRVSFPHVLTARAMRDGADKYYEITLMIDKQNPEQMAWLKTLYNEAQQVLTVNWPDETKRPRLPLQGHDKSPIKDGDTACNQQGIPLKESYPEYAGHYIIRAASAEKGGPIPVVDRNRQAIMSGSEIYGGCMCKVNVNPYARKRADNPGISIGLNGVQKWADGESFGGGRPAVNDMFEASGASDPVNYAPTDDPFGGAGQADPLM